MTLSEAIQYHIDVSRMEESSIIADTPNDQTYEEERQQRLRGFCGTCYGTGSKDGKHLDCPDCMAAEIIADHERRKVEGK
jgi:hypothetical protein